MNWEIKKLGEVCEIEKKKYLDSHLPYVGMEDIESNTGIFLGSTEAKSVKSSTFKFSKHHVLYGRLRPYLNKVMLPNFDGHCSSEIFPIRADLRLDRNFLFYWLTNEKTVRKINKTCTGTRMPRANMKEVLQFYIPVPPIAEQKRIVEILDKSFAGIERAEAIARQNLTNARELFDSYLNNIFTDSKYRESITLSNFAISITDGDHQPPPKSSKGIPFITISNINKQQRTIDFSDTFNVSVEYFDKLKENRKPLKGDVLYTVTGSYGIPVLVKDESKFCFQRHIGLIRPNRQADSKFLYYLLLSPTVKKQANQSATGTAQKTVGLKSLREFIVPKISLEEQKNIVKKLDILFHQTQKLEEIYQRKIEALGELKQSILQKAFSGQLTQ